MDYAEFCKLFVEELPLATQVGDRYYQMGDDLKGFKTSEQRKPYSMGLPLGMRTRDGFVPTLALLTILAKNSERTAVVRDDKAEWLFLCGRDIFTEGFSSNEQEGFVLVQNQKNENLGLARIEKGRDGLLLKAIADRGNYLRHQTIKLTGKKERRKDIYAKRKF